MRQNVLYFKGTMEPTQGQAVEQSGIHSFTSQAPFGLKFTSATIIIFSAAVFLGVISGFVLSRGASLGTSTTSQVTSGNITKGTILGSDDTKTFKDQAEGILKKGGIDGEGAYHLVRPGGESQYVYMTSSLIDLNLLIDRKIKVWGQTQKGQVAGWLMDVGRVEVQD